MIPSERQALMSNPTKTGAREPRSRHIAWVLRIATLLGLAIVVGRVVQLQLAPGDKLEAFIDSRTTSQTLNSTRGDLLDRRGRVLATTRVGYKVIIDPEALHNAMTKDPTAMDRVIVNLAQVLTTPAPEIAQRIIERMVRNDEIRSASASPTAPAGAVLAGLSFGGAPQGPAATPRLSRYLPLSEVLTQQQTQRLREMRRSGQLPGVSLEHDPVREQTSEALVGSIVGKVGFEPQATEKSGVLGAEKLFDERLRGVDGSLTYVRDAEGKPLWVERGAWIDSSKGKDVRLSIDLEIQRIVTEQLKWGVEQADAAGGRAIVLDPDTGEILAMTDILRPIPGLAEVDWWDPKSGTPRPRMPDERDQPRYKVLRDDPGRRIEPALAYNRCLQDVYEPGSTFKPFAWTLAKTKGLLPDDEVLDIKQKSVRTDYGRRITDVYTYDDLNNWDAVIKYSSNIGMYMATSRLSFGELRGAIKALGFGEPTGIGLGGESSGIVTSAKDWDKYTQTSVGMGYEVAVTPIQMVRAFSVFARKGEMAGTLPEVRLTAAGDPTKRGMTGDETIVKRVYSPEAALRTVKPMRQVVERMDKNTARQYPDEPKPQYSMFGKSGTSQIAMVPPKPGLRIPSGTRGYYEKQHYSSFIVGAPADNPQIVVLVVIDDIGPERVRQNHHYGSWVAGPVVRRIVERTLPYLGVPADLGPDDQSDSGQMPID